MAGTRVCCSCTGSEALKKWLRAVGEVQQCSFCSAEAQPTVDAEQFVQRVDATLRKHFVREPLQQEGEDPAKVISRLAGVSDQLATFAVAAGRLCDPGNRPSFYDYALGTRFYSVAEHRTDWRTLTDIVKHEARFFGANTRSLLDRLLGDVVGLCGGVAVRTLTSEDVIFRARLERSAGEAYRFFENPYAEPSAPPRDLATAGRMNAAGVRVFYGALRQDIAVAEVRPPIGSQVVTASFRPARDLRILDPGSLPSVEQYDFFSTDFHEVSGKLLFLEIPEHEISRPVQPHDEVLDYIPTQVVAEYLVHVVGLDGIAYRSAQIDRARRDNNDRNVALFGSAAVSESAGQAPSAAGLRFVAESQQMLDVTMVQVTFANARDEDPWGD